MRLLALLAAGLFAGAVVAAPVPKGLKKPRPDAERFVGTWDGVSGQELGAGNRGVWAFDDRLALTITSADGGRPERRAVTIDPTQTPKAIDLGGYPGIYEVDGDAIRIAWSAGGDRPTSFVPHPFHCFAVLRRAEPKE